jgi:hypothetical protein
LGGLSDVSFLGNETDTTKLDFYSDRYVNTIVNYKTGSQVFHMNPTSAAEHFQNSPLASAVRKKISTAIPSAM